MLNASLFQQRSPSIHPLIRQQARHSSVLGRVLRGVLSTVGSVVRSTVLALEANGLVDHEVSRAGEDGGAEGKANDNAWPVVSVASPAVRTVKQAYRGAEAQAGCDEGGGVSARPCGLSIAQSQRPCTISRA